MTDDEAAYIEAKGWKASVVPDPSIIHHFPNFCGSNAGRAADVQLKERRRLVLLARESPLHLGHLRSMCQAAEIGAIIASPVPAFYLRPQSLTEAIDQIASRAINLLDLPGVRAPARSWQGEAAKT